jgi:hypothetical protein
LRGVDGEAGAAGFDRLLHLAGPREIFARPAEGNRGLLTLEPASKVLDPPSIVHRPASRDY